jgi:hypothetical protein
MKIPKLSYFERKVENKVLVLTKSDIPNPAFTYFIEKFGIREIKLEQVILEEEFDEILLTGHCELPLLGKSELRFILMDSEHPEHFDFEIVAEIMPFSGKVLRNTAWIPPHPLNELVYDLIPEEGFLNLRYLSSTNNLILESESENSEWEIPGLNLTFSNLYLAYFTGLDSGATNQQFELGFELQVGEADLKLAAILPVSSNDTKRCWIIINRWPVYLEDGLDDLLYFLNGFSGTEMLDQEEIKQLIPEPLKAYKDFSITECKMHLNPLVPEISLMRFVLSTFRTIEILPKLNIVDLAFEFNFYLERGEKPKVTLHAEGSFEFSETISTLIQIIVSTDPNEDWTIRMDAGVDLDNIQQLEALAYLKLSDLQLPPEWLQVKRVMVDNLRLVFNPWHAKVRNINFALTLDASSNMIPGIQVKDPYLNINLNFE